MRFLRLTCSIATAPLPTRCHSTMWRGAKPFRNDCKFDEDLFYAWGGTPVAEIIASLNHKHGLNMPREEVAKRKEDVRHGQATEEPPA